MAFESNLRDPHMMQHVFGTQFKAAEPDQAAEVNEGMEALRVCANFFFVARSEKTIVFKRGVTEGMLEIMGLLLTRAAHCNAEERSAMLQRWTVDGPLQCSELIAEVAQRESKILDPDDFAMFLKCPRRW